MKQNKWIRFLMKCLIFVAVLTLVAIPSYVLRGRNHLEKHIGKHPVAYSSEMESVTEKNLSATFSPDRAESAFRRREYGETSPADLVTVSSDQIESAYRRLGIDNIQLMQKMDTPRPLFNFTTTPSEAKCRERARNDTLEPRWSMIVGVKSQTNHFDQRDVVRGTWGSYKLFHGVRLEVIFVVGNTDNVQEISKLQAESEKHEDILQIERKEIYKDVGYKALAAMQWSGEHCPSHWIYSSADDDVVPNLVGLYKDIDNFIESSQGQRELTPILCGYGYRYPDKVLRPPYRNSVLVEVYPLDAYPPFCAGGFYSMPIALSAAIYNISRHHEYFYNDDVWITGLLRLSLFDFDPVFVKNFGCDVSSEFCGISKKNPRHVIHTFGENIEKEWEKIKKRFPKP